MERTGLPYSPRDPCENIVHEERFDRIRSDRDGDQTGHDSQTDEDGAFVTEALRYDPIDEETNDLTDVGTLGTDGQTGKRFEPRREEDVHITESCLPWGGYLVCPIG